MIVLKKSHKNLSYYNQFLFKKKFEFNKKKEIIFSKKLRNSGNYIHYYYSSFVIQATILVGSERSERSSY